MKHKQVSVVGCGRTGLRIALLLLERNYKVRAVARSVRQSLPRHPHFDFWTEEIFGESIFLSQPEFSQSNAVVVCLPPSAGLAVFEKVFQAIPADNAAKVILLSSTSVYGNLTGQVFEEDKPTELNPRGKKQLEVEELLAKAVKNWTILRCGGLISSERHPGLFFPSGRGSGSGSESVNLVHEIDVARAVVHCLESETEGVFNCVYPLYPPRSEFYASASAALGRPPIIFDHHVGLGKKVSPEKLLKTGFEFHHAITALENERT